MEHQLLENTRKIGDIALFIACLLEIILFYSPTNIVGCFMTIVSWLIFSRIFLHRHIILLHPFSFIVFFSMSMYRILPLYATLLEFKPISFKFEYGEKTFLLELFLYLVSCLSFSLIAYRKPSNNFISKSLYYIKFHYPLNKNQMWCMGGIGILIHIYLLFITKIETGEIINKIIQSFIFLKYAPIIMLFPILYNPFSKQVFKTNRIIFIYTGVLFLLCFTSNSRQTLLEPIMLIVILTLLAFVKSKTSYQKYLSSKIPIILIVLIVTIPLLSNISDAMLIVRGTRNELTKKELFYKTINTVLDKEKLSQNRNNNKKNNDISYKEGWTEEYLSNFALNRFCNIRISDLTLYHTDQIGYENKNMKEDLKDRIIKLLPNPILKHFNIKVDKNNLYSRGDYLYALSTNTPIFSSLRVTSHIADGLATFGHWYFFIQFILFYIQFWLLDCFVFYKRKRVLYSICGLIFTYYFIGKFRNANGCFDEISFIIRGFIQIIVIYSLSIFLVRKIIR